METETPDGERTLIAIVGPTAVGKTAVGVHLAERIGGEVISADAVAVYRGLNIGAAKPDAQERARARFHLVDVVDPDQEFTVADFEQQANAAIEQIRNRGHAPIVVGGTGLYVRAVVARLTVPNVPPQPELRARLQNEAYAQGAAALYARLAAIDPGAAARILPADVRRTIRALEVYLVSGRPMSSFHTPEGVHGVPRANTVVYGLRMERAALYRRIESRVDTMMEQGFLEEVRDLLAAGYGPAEKSMQSLGYRHLLRHLTEGQPLEEAVAELKRDTRRFAKRQMAWFNADSQVNWIDVAAEGTTAEAVAAAIAARSEQRAQANTSTTPP